MAELKSGSTIGGYTIWHRGNFDPATKLNANANAVSASKLETPRTISTTGDGTWSVSFDGTTNTTATLTLASTGVTAGTYKAVTVDVKGRVTTGLALTTGLVTSTTSAGTSNVNTINTNTYLNVVETVGASPSSAGTSTQIIGAGTVTVTSDTAGKLTITGSQSITGNAATATKLATARTINGTSFNGSANITTANWGTARTLTIGSTGKSVNGSANVSWSLAEIGAAAASHTHDYLPTSGGTLSGNLSVTGTITATGNITAFSDARLKDNITKIPDALNKLNQLKGVTYTRKDLASDTQYAGLIAQDVQKILPEAVAVTEDDIIAVDYNGVIGLLVEAIKELESKVAALEGK